MRSKSTLGLAAIALGFGITATSAATIEPRMLVTSDNALLNMQPPAGTFTSGLSTIKTRRANTAKDNSLLGISGTGSAASDSLVRPETGNNSWRDTLTELSGAPPASLSQRIDAQQELRSPQGGETGFAAIKAAAGRRDRSNAGLDSQLSSVGAAASGSLVNSPSK